MIWASITGRIESIVGGLWETSSAPTETMKASYKVAEEMFDEIYQSIKKIGGTDIKALEDKLEAAGAPYTPGRLPGKR